jgi:hypothetical protein
MYPFKAILVGDTPEFESVRRELHTAAAEVEAAFLDASAAITWLTQAPEARRLFVVSVSGPDPLQGIKQLRGACVGQPLLALTDGAAVDKEGLLRLMRAGVDQVVFLPLQSGDFRVALETLAWQFGQVVGQSPTVAVIGVTPGSGITTVAVNLAHEIARLGRN